jgi:hypothetical protein
MTTAWIETTFATGDVDRIIVRCGLNKTNAHPTVAIVGEMWT